MTSDYVKASKGLEFPLVALPGVGHMPSKGEDEQEVARGILCGGDTNYVAAGHWGGWGCRVSQAGSCGIYPLGIETKVKYK